jgi:hypothetical protein
MKKTSFILGLVLLLLIPFVSARIIWKDNFNDRDLDGWSFYAWNFIPFFSSGFVNPPIPLSPPEYTGEAKILQPVGSYGPGEGWAAAHPSDVAYGTWSFDVLVTEDTVEHFYIYFMTDDWWGPTPYPFDIQGYDLVFVMAAGQAWSWEIPDSQAGFVLAKRNGGPPLNWVGLDSYAVGPIIPSGNYKVVITRTLSGVFNVYINGEHVLNAQDNEISESTYFIITGPGPSIDNIKIKNTLRDK